MHAHRLYHWGLWPLVPSSIWRWWPMLFLVFGWRHLLYTTSSARPQNNKKTNSTLRLDSESDSSVTQSPTSLSRLYIFEREKRKEGRIFCWQRWRWVIGQANACQLAFWSSWQLEKHNFYLGFCSLLKSIEMARFWNKTCMSAEATWLIPVCWNVWILFYSAEVLVL